MNESDTTEHTILGLVVSDKLFVRLALLNETMSEMKPRVVTSIVLDETE